jgi:hypothetical protein
MNARVLVDFYAGRGTDFRGRTIEDVWRMSLDELEYTHDYIQWLFPLRERSAVQPNVPVLDDSAIAAFADPDMRGRLTRSAEVMARFYGFVMVDSRLELATNAADRQAVWLTRGNHNFLRLTRIMKSLCALGLPDLAQKWLDALRGVYEKNPDVIGPETWRYWTTALAPDAT